MSVLSYQFEPVETKKSGRQDSSDRGWEDIEELDENKPDTSVSLLKLNRITCELSVWCKCSCCATMPVNRECLCCVDINDIKYQKLSDCKNYSRSILYVVYFVSLVFI